MIYFTLYDYFRDNILKPYTKVLDGEELKSSPTQREASEALKTLWQKLGGTITTSLFLAFSSFSAIDQSMQWQDVPPTTILSNAYVAGVSASQVSNEVTGIMSKIHINGQQLSENVNITTFAKFNDSWPNRGGTMNELCSAISSDPTATRGMCFLGEIQGKDKMPDVALGNCEVIVKICKNGVINFEAFSTDTGTKHWDGVGYGSTFLGWRQVATAPEVNEDGEYILKMKVQSSGGVKDYYWEKQ